MTSALGRAHSGLVAEGFLLEHVEHRPSNLPSREPMRERFLIQQGAARHVHDDRACRKAIHPFGREERTRLGRERCRKDNHVRLGERVVNRVQANDRVEVRRGRQVQSASHPGDASSPKGTEPSPDRMPKPPHADHQDPALADLAHGRARVGEGGLVPHGATLLVDRDVEPAKEVQDTPSTCSAMLSPITPAELVNTTSEATMAGKSERPTPAAAECTQRTPGAA